MIFDKFYKRYMCIDKVLNNNHFLFTVNKTLNIISDFMFGFWKPTVNYQNILNVIDLWLYYHEGLDALFHNGVNRAGTLGLCLFLSGNNVHFPV